MLARAGAEESLALLKQAASAHFETAIDVTIDTSGRHGEVQTVAARRAQEEAARIAAARKAVAEHPAVVAAIEVLGAELRDVRLPESG